MGYPVYHATLDPRYVNNDEELKALGQGWGTQYIHKEYPKWMYKGVAKELVLSKTDEAKRIADGWSGKPPVEAPQAQNSAIDAKPAAASSGDMVFILERMSQVDALVSKIGALEARIALMESRAAGTAKEAIAETAGEVTDSGPGAEAQADDDESRQAKRQPQRDLDERAAEMKARNRAAR